MPKKKAEENAVEEAEKVVEKVLKKVEETAKEIFGDAKKPKKEKKISIDSEKKAKLSKLLEKAKKLEGTVEEKKDLDLKSGLKGEQKKDTLMPIDDYLKSSVHIGTRVITPEMRKFVIKRRADGLAVFDYYAFDDRIREAAEFLSKYAPEDMIIVCKREAGWKALEKFSELTGARIYTKKYPAGVLTNSILDKFIETELVFICDPWLDKNALSDAKKIKIPVMAVCDTNNYTAGISKIIPANNKSAKSLGMIFYLLTKLYSEKRNLKIKMPPISEFIDDWDNLQPPK